MRLDAHQHFWAYDAQQYPWIPRDGPLHHDWFPADLEREQEKVGLHGSIAVQARQTVEESRWLLTLADHAPLIRGVVGWVDLRSPTVGRDLEELAGHPKFVGVRHVVQDEPDDDFLIGADFVRGLRALAAWKLRYDLLVVPKQLPAAIRLVKQLPEQPFVLDHIAKPPIKTGALSPWREQIRELAREPNVWCKVSGIITEADPKSWTPEEIKPYLDVVFEAFSPKRLMFGSDWPVCLLAGSYEQVYRLIDDYTRTLSETERNGIFGENAARFYGVK
jgi:L-fucono-1,5-lactonase